MQTDRELMELAAVAAGMDYLIWTPGAAPLIPANKRVVDRACWHPLSDDGDALRLMVKLGISTLPYPVYNEGERHSVVAKQRRKTDTLREANPTEVLELYGDDPYAATRKAIVRAAAEIGKEILSKKEE
jgi:hypothetical protein